MAERSRGTRERVCARCGCAEIVRADNPAPHCKSCASSIATTARWEAGTLNDRAKPAARAKEVNCKCLHCGLEMYRSPSAIGNRVFCSKACHDASRTVARTCKQCGATFMTQQSRLSGKTNSSANFCGRPCYEQWLCDTPRTRNRGVRWHVVSKAARDAFPFCAMCGASCQMSARRLETHHITPYRLTQDNSPENLIPLCSRCHKIIEVATVGWLKESGGQLEMLPFVVGSWLRRRQAMTTHVLKRLVNERRNPSNS